MFAVGCNVNQQPAFAGSVEEFWELRMLSRFPTSQGQLGYAGDCQFINDADKFVQLHPVLVRSVEASIAPGAAMRAIITDNHIGPGRSVALLFAAFKLLQSGILFGS